MKKNDHILSKAKENLSQNSLNLFECLVDKLKNINADEIDIQFDDDKDFVSICLTAEFDNKISFYVDIYNGYWDFFIDNGKEVFIQYKFKSIQAAAMYFEKFLSASIKYTKTETEEGKLWEEKYAFLNHGKETILSGQTRFSMMSKPKLVKSEKTWNPWTLNKTTANKT